MQLSCGIDAAFYPGPLKAFGDLWIQRGLFFMFKELENVIS
jgi:hypothetical protein